VELNHGIAKALTKPDKQFYVSKQGTTVTKSTASLGLEAIRKSLLKQDCSAQFNITSHGFVEKGCVTGAEKAVGNI
jgi:hypothetical protein